MPNGLLDANKPDVRETSIPTMRSGRRTPVR